MDTPRFLRTTCLLGAVGAAGALASSCAVTRPEDVNRAYEDVLDQRHNRYVFKPGDQVSIRLYNRPGDLNQTDVLVLPDGKSDVFFMDGHLFLGKTVAELEAELKAKVAGEVRDAEVSIQVAPKDEVAYLVGQFERPGTVTLTTKMTLHEAVSSVGGTRITGDTDWALLRRPYRDPRHPELFRIDLNDEVEQVFLLPGDQVILNRTFLAGLINYLREYVFGILPGGASPTSYGSFASFAAF
ncbi:MAG: polysaccharide biosynthesis/export family protein [Planctomycetes bacterium]|nr:polysaccharide biosynthesis/export family protein [Planctomycetota bacterium]